MILYSVVVRDPETDHEEVKATFTESWMAYSYVDQFYANCERKIISWQALNPKVEDWSPADNEDE